MVTTIQLSERTRNRLLKYKKEQGKTYDEVIQDLLEEKERVPASMYGALPELPPWDRETDRARGRYE